MARVKGGPQGHLRHKKVLKITKGQRGAKHRLFKRANEAMLKAFGTPPVIAACASVTCANCGSPVLTPQPV